MSKNYKIFDQDWNKSAIVQIAGKTLIQYMDEPSQCKMWKLVCKLVKNDLKGRLDEVI